MAKFKFIYEGLNDEFEYGKKIELSFGNEHSDGMTTNQVADMFSEFLKAVGYVFDDINIVSNFDSELGH
jgi:hypothetical protein